MPSTLSSTASSTISSATATCTTAIPGKNGYVDPSACNALYEYYPSFGAAILFSFLFGVVTILHIYLAANFRKVFVHPAINRRTLELILPTDILLGDYNGLYLGNGFFHPSNNFYASSNKYQLLHLLFSPRPTCSTPYVLHFTSFPSTKSNHNIVINAFDYMILGRMVHFYLPSKSLFHIPASRFSRYFVWLDILAFLVQLGGGLIVSGTNVKPSTFQLGIHIYMAGIGLQQFFICVFTGLAIMFQTEVLKLERKGQFVEKGWRRMLYTLYGSLGLITVRFPFTPSISPQYSLLTRGKQLRIIYRLVEYARGEDPNNPIPYHEAFFYCLDATPMFIAATIMCITHPGMILKGPNAEFPKMSRKEKKAEKQRKKELKKGAKLLEPEEGLMEGHEMQRPITPEPGMDGYGRSGYAGAGGEDRYEPYRGFNQQESV
jgi:hypothetical protein